MAAALNPVAPNPDTHPAARLADDWAAHLSRDRRRSPHTVRAYLATAHRLIDFLGRHLGAAVTPEALRSLEASDLRAFLARRRAEGLANRSAAREMSAVRGFLT
ncbi:MAG: site-specific integrase, partial [Sphingomonadales bacterium]|nr:site-specific integrase [Sphingomonadales bacterium]